MAKQLNVNLSMTADTSQAKIQLQQLQQQLTQLTKISSSGSGGFGITKEIQEASVAAAQLKVQLKAATDVNTGKLDLSKFNQELIKSNMSISKYHTALSAIGPDGEKAFAQLAASISNADARITNANSKLSQFAVTLANTARWQISSSVLHGFMGAMSSAYNYAQNLNESLNQIRIVTGQNTDQMAKFAKQANEAAKTLSTTTTSYTNASLIYYQQGLSDSEVKERTDITIKMANAANQSAEIISDQLTAVWNNFAKGSDNLEHYADAMTRLGADTASSTDEIAEGLEKFASVADLIGLSFDNAAAALATVTATTRQSADIVGTAFKTIFARIQGLNLGETLDDGTDLNKYSKALDTVGINIKDQNDELKDMDTILDEMGSKWKTLSKDQQTALAQTVAGVRQYTQLVSLMDNWDFYQQNLELAKNSDGSLQEQADIYAESWEAAQKRVRASAEAIYSSLLNDKFFIEVNNGFSKFLDLINSTIKGLGGVKGVLLTVGTIITQVFQKQIAESLSNFSLGVVGLTKKGKQKVEDLRTQANNELIKNAFDDGTLSGSATASAYKAQGDAQQTLINNAKNMTEEQKNIAQLLLDQNQALKEAALNQAEVARSAEDEATSAKRTFEIRNKINTIQGKEALKKATDTATRLGRISAVDTGLASSAENINFSNINDKKSQTAIKNLQTSIADLQRGYSELGITAEEALGKEAAEAFSQMAGAFDKDGNLIEGKIDALHKAWLAWTEAFAKEGANYDTYLDNLAGVMSGVTKATIENGTATEEQAKKFAECREQAKLMTESCVNAGQAESDMAAKSGTLVTNLDRIKAKMAEMSQSSISMSQALTQISSTIMSAGMIITNITGLIEVWNDDQAELSTKLLTTASTLGMVIPSIISVAKGFEKAKSAVTLFGIETSLAMWQVTAIMGAITLLTVAVVAFANSVDASSKKAQQHFTQMAEDAQIAADALSEAENSYKSLQETINSYNDARENIDSLTRGTEEFKEAVIEANKVARELIETYSVVSTYDANTGLIRIDPKDLEDKLDEEQSRLEQARVNNVAAQSNKLMASSDLSNAKMSEKNNDLTYWEAFDKSAKGNIVSGAAAGASIGGMAGGIAGTIAGPLGNAVGAGVAAGLGGILGSLLGFGKTFIDAASYNKDRNDSEVSALEALQEAYIQSGGNFEIAMDSLSEDQKGLIDSLGSTDSELEALCSEVSANTAAILQNNKELVDSNLADNENYQNSKYKDQLNTMLADTLTDETDRLYDTYYSDDAGELTDKEAQQQYAELMGYTWVANKNGNVGVYSKGDGSADFTLSDETARRALAQKEAMDALDENIEAYSKTLETVSQTGESFGAGLGDLMLRLAGGQGASFSDVSGSQLKALQSQLDDTENVTDIISDEDAQNMGYADAQTYIDALQAGINSYYDAIEKVKDNLTTSVEAVFNDLDTEDLSVDAAQNLGDTLTKAFINAGSDGLTAVEEVYSGITEGSEEFADALVEIDWQTATVSDVTEALNEAGVTGNWTTEQLQALIDALYETGEASLESATSQYAALHKIVDGLKFGDTISAEDMSALGDEFKSYFMLMADGTYKLVGDAEEFYSAVQNKSMQGFVDIVAQTNNSNKNIDRIQNYSFTDENGFGANLTRITDTALDSDKVRAQLDLLKETNSVTAEQLAEWENTYNKWAQTGFDRAEADSQSFYDIAQAVDSWTESVGGASAAEEFLSNKVLENNAILQETREAMAASASSVEELDALLRNGQIDALAYTKAFAEFDQTATLDGLDSEEVADYANYLEEVNDDLKDHEGMSIKVAASIKRLNRGINSLADNWEDWSDVLKNSSEDSEEFYEALQNTKEAISDITGVSTDYISKDFIANHMDEISQAAKGDEDAIDSLKTAMADEVIAKIWLDNADFISNLDDAKAAYDNVKALMPDLKVGASLDDGEFINALNDLILQSSMTVPQVNEMLAGMGFSANFATEPQEVQIREPDKVTTHHTIANKQVTTMEDGSQAVEWDDITTTTTEPGEVHEGKVDAYSLETSEPGTTVTPKINSITKTASGASNNYSSSNSGGKSPGSGSGGGSSKSKAKKPDKSNIVERYKEITDALDDNTRAMDKASKAADRLYGKDRIEYLKKNVSLLKERRKLLEQEQSEIAEYLKKDKEALKEAANAAGVNLAVDPESGNILNYRSEMEKLEDRINALKEAAYADKEITDAEQEQIDSLQELIDTLLDAISQYDETNKKFKDNAEDLQDNIDETMDKNYEILHYELEIKIEVNDLELDKIEYYINKLSDDFYSMAEVAGYMNQKFSEAQDALGYYEGFYNNLNAAFANGEISKEKYVEGLKESYSAILDQLTSLNDLDKEMMHYYGDTLDAAADELSYYTDQLEHLNSVLDHYKNLVTLVNGELDYKSIGKILDGQAKVLKNQLDVASANYKMLLSEKAEIEQSLANAQDEAARELFEEELKAITTKVNEAQEEMLSKTEEWAEAQKAIMENAMAEAAKAMEKEFTDGLGFDALSNSIDRLNSYADEYLTKTNQIYETQKLINTAQQAADKTTNEAAKARLNSYMKEVETLQEKNQLSNLELEIAKAKYDVVLAEIALEEAQNAKSTVRLQRDNEGNFGYVYTANQDDVSKAEQDLADAQNRLYNIGLEGTNEYGQKLLELQQKLADDLVALEEARAAGQYATDEEYYAARDQLISEYNDLFRAYSEQYTTAMGVDANIQQEAWINAYESMINKTGEWQDKTSTYIEKCEESYSSWRQVVEDESEIIDGILNDLESEVDDVTKSSDELYEEVKNKIVPGLKDELVAVRNVTSAYAAQRQQIQELISYYERLTQSILAAIRAQSGLSGSSGSSELDYSQDFSAKMKKAWEQGDMESYEKWKQLREEKIAAGYSDWGVSTDWIDDYLKNGGELPDGMTWVDLYKQLNGGFATGGFTGAWGPEGKLTFLHEKELVLNKDDTANFLTATNMLRDISDMIDLKALQDKVSILPYLPGVSTNGSGDTLEQTVTIEAHFPSVTSHNEIEEAFNTLVNRASQYANRK